jgi:hypothetical protein
MSQDDGRDVVRVEAEVQDRALREIAVHVGAEQRRRGEQRQTPCHGDDAQVA